MAAKGKKSDELKNGVPNGSGHGAVEAGAEAPIDELEWQRRFFIEHRLRQARIPRRFWSKTLGNFKKSGPLRRDLVRAAEAFAMSFSLEEQGRLGVECEQPELHPGLLMRGPVGSGKSHLAVGILREVVAKGYSGLYYNSPDLLRDIRATYDGNADGPSEDSLLDEVTNVDLLVLDDLGAEKVSGFVLDRFYLVVNKRYEGCKPLIVTTNLDEETLQNRLGDRIVSRLYEMCSADLRFPQEDFRRLALDGRG